MSKHLLALLLLINLLLIITIACESRNDSMIYEKSTVEPIQSKETHISDISESKIIDSEDNIPQDWPKDIQIPSGFVLSTTTTNHVGGFRASFKSTRPAHEVREFYLAAMVDWTVREQDPMLTSGKELLQLSYYKDNETFDVDVLNDTIKNKICVVCMYNWRTPPKVIPEGWPEKAKIMPESWVKSGYVDENGALGVTLLTSETLKDVQNYYSDLFIPGWRKAPAGTVVTEPYFRIRMSVKFASEGKLTISSLKEARTNTIMFLWEPVE